MKTAIRTALENIEKERMGFIDPEYYFGLGRAAKILTDLLPTEEEQIKQAYGDGLNPHRYDNCNRDEYFDKVFKTDKP